MAHTHILKKPQADVGARQAKAFSTQALANTTWAYAAAPGAGSGGVRAPALFAALGDVAGHRAPPRLKASPDARRGTAISFLPATSLEM